MKNVKLNGSLRDRYSNALHAQFNDNMCALVGTLEQSITKIPLSVYGEWRKSINLEIDINREISASANTKLMVEKDGKRNLCITYLFNTIRTECQSPFAEKRDAADHLVLYVEKYKGLQSEADDTKTLHTKGLILDFNESENAGFCTTLGLNDTIDLLDALNSDFESLKVDRTAQRTENKLPPSKDVRRQTDILYDQICKVIEVSHMLATDEAQKKALASLIAKMNQYITETKGVFHKMQAAGKDKHSPETPTDKPDVDTDLPSI